MPNNKNNTEKNISSYINDKQLRISDDSEKLLRTGVNDDELLRNAGNNDKDNQASSSGRILLRAFLKALLFAGAFILGMSLAAGYILKENARAEAESSALYGEMLTSGRPAYVSLEKEIRADHETGEAIINASVAEGSGYDIRLTLLRRATGEILLETGRIDPGFYVERAELRTELIRGRYDCTAVWELYDRESGKLSGRAAENVVLIIE